MTRFVIPGGGKLSLVFGSLLAGSAFAGIIGACADDDAAATVDNDASITLDAAIGNDTSPPIVDAGCDSSDPNCVTTQVSCDAVAWCLVPSTVSSAYVLKAVWGTAANDVWAAGSGGTIIHWDGSAWTPSTSGIPNTFNAIWGSSAQDVYVVSGNTAILHGTGAPVTWAKVDAPIDEFTAASINAVWGSSANDVHIGGSFFSATDSDFNSFNANGFVHSKKADAGADAGDASAIPYWDPAPGTALVYGMWGSSASDVWIVGDNSQFVDFQTGYTQHGKPGEAGTLEFSDVDSQSTDVLESVFGTSASDVWAVGAGGTIRHFGSTDTRWQIVDSPTKAPLHSVWASSPTDMWAVGDSGTILHFDGMKVTTSDAELPIGQKPALYGVWGSGPNDVWIAGDGVLLHYTGPKAGGDK